MVIPEYFVIEPTRQCNFSCFMCPNQYYSESEKGHMDIGIFTKIIEEIKQFANLIQLYWMGEPLMNPKIFDFINIVKSRTKAKVVISTNGSLLSHYISDQLLSMKLDKLIIDVDATTEDIYQKIRSKGTYEQLLANIEYIISSSQSTEIILQFLHFKINHNEMEHFLNRWKRSNCITKIDWVDTWTNQMPELADLAFSLSPYRNQERQPCADLWHRMVINYRGEVNLCCHDYKPIYNLGNVTQKGIIELWNSDILSSFRDSHIKSKYWGLCKECNEWAKAAEYEELMR